MRFGMIIVLLAVIAESSVQAGPLRRYRPTRNVSTAPTQAAVQTTHASSAKPADPASTVESKPMKGVDDALAEVNAERARRGLRPFLPDKLLNEAARSCAKIRATNLIEGHLPNDFVHLPAGASAAAAGCGALEPSWGWGTCCTYENFKYAGAAWVMGADGNRYMHLFVR